MKALLFLLAFFLLGVARAGQITLIWDQPPPPPVGDRVTAYRIYYGVSSGTYTNNVLVGDVTQAIVPGLIDGCAYFFAATAVDSAGSESDYSAEVLATPGIPPSVDSVVINSGCVSWSGGLGADGF